MLRRSALLLVLVLGSVSLGSTAAAAPPAPADNRPGRAKEAFAAGRYDEALQIFVKLYAETLDPIYLRVIGRCYQNLDDPEKAIHSFREYLRKSPKLEPAKRAEIEGYIAEMNDLLARRQQAATASPVRPVEDKPEAAAPAAASAAPPPPPAPAATSAPDPTATPALAARAPLLDAPPPPQAAPPAMTVTLPARPNEAPAPTAPSHRWLWIAIGAGVLLAAGAAAFLVLRLRDPACPTDGTVCCPKDRQQCP